MMGLLLEPSFHPGRMCLGLPALPQQGAGEKLGLSRALKVAQADGLHTAT